QDEDRTDATAFEVDRDGEARRGVAEGSTVASTMARMGPSIPAHPRVLGASMHTISEVTGRAAKPVLLVLTHRAPRSGTRLVHPPVDDAFCHSEKGLGSPRARRRRPNSPHSRLVAPV
ncbi:MAG TPA: hypothetical protein VKC63_09705, partial [Solirubrobacterales bacterium]|nr:hypothetical protein [Solirubrobacterales bacterium]